MITASVIVSSFILHTPAAFISIFLFDIDAAEKIEQTNGDPVNSTNNEAEKEPADKDAAETPAVEPGTKRKEAESGEPFEYVIIIYLDLTTLLFC